MPAIITDLTSLKIHGKALDADLAEVFAKYGLKMGVRRGTVYPETGTLKYSIECAMGSGEDQSAKAKAFWEKYAPMFDLPADAFGKEITFGDGKYTVTGINPNKPKNCVSLTRVRDGKAGFQCPADNLIKALKREAMLAKFEASKGEARAMQGLAGRI